MENTFTSNNTANSSSYALNIDFHDKSQWKDSIPLVILIMIGILGVFYVLQNSSELGNTKKSSPVSYFTSNNLPEESSSKIIPVFKKESKATTLSNNKKHAAAIVKIRGVLEAKERVTFKIDNYDASFLYTIDFGNGIIRNINKKRVSYIYPSSGVYIVKIMAENGRGIRQNVYSKLISIDKAINVYDNAHLERQF